MLLIIALLFLAALFLFGCYLIDDYRYAVFSMILEILTGLFGVAAFIALLALPFARMSSRSFVREFKSVELTIRQQRERGFTDYERFQLTKTIIEYNSNLAIEQYYAASPWVSVFYTRDMLDLKPIN